ncbi:MAG: fructose-bisphosphatase class II, partial [Bauldia sp.]
MNEQPRLTRRAPALERILTLELVRVTERAAVAAARLRGRGGEIAPAPAAVDP